MKATKSVKATSKPVLAPSIIACSSATTPIPKRNPSVMPTAIIVKILVLMAPACGRPDHPIVAPGQRIFAAQANGPHRIMNGVG